MARVYRHTWSKRFPDGRREKRTCPKWYVEYTEASGRVRRVPGYTDKRATEAYANELQRRVDREKAGIIDRESVEFSRELSVDIERHIEAYRVHLQASDVSDWHLSETTRRLRRVIRDCGITRLLDIRAEPIQRWSMLRKSEGMGARTLNTYTGSLRAFVRWCVADGRMSTDPLGTLTRADESSDVRRVRRSLTDDEFASLLSVALRRPLLDVMTIRRGPRKGQVVAKVKARVRAHLERLGRERRLIYMALVLTGLRRGELAALTWDDVSLDDGDAWLTVRASVSKNGKSETLPIRDDLAHELRTWREECGNPAVSAALFNVPKGLVHILKRDLKAADIDPIGVDVHSLRHTTATHLAKAGIAPRTAQSIMRHSDIRLTFGAYTDPRLLDTAGALDALPSIKPLSDRDRQRATGTNDRVGSALGAQLGGKVRPAGQFGAKTCTDTDSANGLAPNTQPVVSAQVSNELQRDSAKRATRLELVTFSLEG